MPGFEAVAPYLQSSFAGHPDTLRAMVEVVQGPRGEKSMLVRSATEAVIRRVEPKDYLGEILAIRYWAMEKLRYTSDPLHIELVKDPERMLVEIDEHGSCAADCDEAAALIACMSLQIGRKAEFVVAGFAEPGAYSHVFPIVEEPRSNAMIVADIVAGTDERGMLDRITTFYRVSLDAPPSAVHGGFFLQ